MNDHAVPLHIGNWWVLSTLEKLASSFKSPRWEVKDGLVVGRLNSRDRAPNPIGLQAVGRTSAVYPWSGTESSFGHRFFFHRYLQQWVFIPCGSPCATLIWVKFASNTHRPMWALIFLKKNVYICCFHHVHQNTQHKFLYFPHPWKDEE